MADIASIKSSGQVLQNFLNTAKGVGSVQIKDGEVQKTPAKQGFFSRVVQWIKGNSSAKINEQTRTAFTKALIQAFGKKVANEALQDYRLLGKDVGKPLEMRHVREILNKAVNNSNLEKMGLNFEAANKPIIDHQAKTESIGRENQALMQSSNMSIEENNDAINQARVKIKQADSELSRTNIRDSDKAKAQLEIATQLRTTLDQIKQADKDWVHVDHRDTQ